jgi:hypothetical protein
LSKKSSSASATDFIKILGDFPPSSNVTGIIFSVAYCMTNLPVGVDPVNAAFDTFSRYFSLFIDCPLTGQPEYLEKYKNKIVDILISEGKKTLGDQVHAGTLSFINFIYTSQTFIYA